jgi:serine/threonine protein kinase
VILAGEEFTATTSSGPNRWNAPELLSAIDVYRTCQSDVYAFGCTCLEVRVADIPVCHDSIKPGIRHGLVALRLLRYRMTGP